ncbi:MAG: hypothetical protein E4H20_04660 [Spirochaetales bacterium]|nr:MAG: hypothetical protein E4H20_04660 [Spirochaetales bacterium]
MPDPNNDAVDVVVDDAVADPNVSAVKAIADEFRASLAEMRTAQVAPPPAVPAGPSLQDKIKDLSTRQTQVRAEYDELCAAGEYSKGAEHLLRFQAEVNQASQGDPTDAPAYKAMIVTARRDAKRDNEPMFAKYGADIEAEISSMSPGDRINPDAWDEAVRRVKAQHIDEIIEDRLTSANKTREEEEAAKKPGGRFVAPVAAGSAGKLRKIDVVELDDNQLAAAKMLNFTPAQYAEVLVAAEAKTIRSGWAAGMHELCDTDKPEPGRF